MPHYSKSVALVAAFAMLFHTPPYVSASFQINLMSPEAEAAVHPIDHLLSSYRAHKGHGESLALLSSLSLPHSCLYSSITENIISKCSSAPTALDGEEKAFLATKLAVCEFSSANINYPRECQGPLHVAKDIQRCIRRLESRPQWWTSWSNCIQSVGVLCQAVREEAERENLLRLHRNLTLLNYELESRLATSLDLFSTNYKHADGLSTVLRSKFAVVVDELDSIIDHTISPMDERLQHLLSLINRASELQAAHVAKSAERVEISNERANSQRTVMEESSRLAEQLLEGMRLLETKMNTHAELDEDLRLRQTEQMQVAIKTSTADTLSAIMESMQSLGALSSHTSSSLNTLLDSISQGKAMVDGINTDFEILSSAHDKISAAMRSQQVFIAAMHFHQLSAPPRGLC
ncbi:hypothetical protein DRE_03879 [Drechslerella stenobrocha 248]|uniref:Nuclear fusion protein KAR5 n=1 Tax=Drechslerella stenobrocha 248 TaxID=1043628 RepID=W7I398_9PEZI|nr:hypothetical protein DRE_03879 [Drechslerella stenobrocha 248]